MYCCDSVSDKVSHTDVHLQTHTAAKEGNNDKKESGGGGWGFNILKYIIPKRKNQAHLPDDKKKSVSCLML